MKLLSKILAILLLCPVTAFAQATKVDIIALDSGIENSVVNVGTSATALPVTVLSGRKSIIIKNLSSGVVYLGKSDVTADTTAATGGFQIAQSATFQADIGENTVLYGVVASGTSDVSILEVR